MYGARRDGVPAKLYSFCSASCHRLKDLVVHSAHDRMCCSYPVSAMIMTDKFLESPGDLRIVIDGGDLSCVPDTVSTGINTIMQYLHPPTASQGPHCEHKCSKESQSGEYQDDLASSEERQGNSTSSAIIMESASYGGISDRRLCRCRPLLRSQKTARWVILTTEPLRPPIST
jgi:hypothetical protein